MEQKKKALIDFENVTSKDIKDQIVSGRQKELDGIKKSIKNHMSKTKRTRRN